MLSKRKPRRRRLHVEESYRPLVVATLMMLIVGAIGIIGFAFLQPTYSLIDAVYMTVITLTTVGFEEHIVVRDRPVAMIFTIAILFLGVGTFVYFFSNLTEFFVAGNFERLIWRRKMRNAIHDLRDHYIVCGGGETGKHIVEELVATQRSFVLVESSQSIIDDLHHSLRLEFPAVVGDATSDENLRAAAIDRARGLFASLGNDKENLLVTVSARLLNPRLRIVSKCIDLTIEEKIRNAGADVVVSPTLIGGLRMTSEMVRPTVVSFLDVMLRDRDRRYRVEESAISPGSMLDGKTVGFLREKRIGEALLVAIRLPSGDWIYNPRDDMKLSPDANLVFIGSPDAREAIERATGTSKARIA